jgi:ferredoxin
VPNRRLARRLAVLFPFIISLRVGRSGTTLIASGILVHRDRSTTDIQRGTSVKPRIDSAICSGHGRCYTLAPDVYEPDDEGFGVVKMTAIPPDLQDAVMRGIQNCPERAISVVME